jgi:hypothetical protein
VEVNFSMFGTLPVDVLPYVFKQDTSELLNKALVCRLWKQAAYSGLLDEMIRPDRAMGIREMKKINGRIVSHESEEAHMPFVVFKNIAEKENAGLKNWWLIHKSNKVKVMNDDGNVEEVPLRKLRIIGNLCNTAFTHSWDLALDDERKEESSHWEWIELKVLGLNENYAQQLNTAKNEDKKAYPKRYEPEDKVSRDEKGEPKQIVQMADADVLVLAMPMAKALFNEVPFSYDLATWKEVLLRTKTITIDKSGNKWPIVVCVVPSGLYVDGRRYDDARVGFVCARKSFVT